MMVAWAYGYRRVWRARLLVSFLLLPVASGAQRPSHQITLTPVWSISSEQADLSPIGSAVAVGSELYLAQPDDHQVVRFDTGSHDKLRIGRDGEGPGEFRQVLGIGMFGKRVWAVDMQRVRVSIFNPDGKLYQTFPLPGAITTRSVEAIGRGFFLYGMPSMSGLVGIYFVQQPPGLSRWEFARDSTNIAFVSIDRTGKLVRHLGWTHSNTKCMAPVPGTGGRRALPILFCHPALFMASPGGDLIAIVNPASAEGNRQEYSIVEVNSSGDTVLLTSVRVSPPPVSTEARDSAMNALQTKLSHPLDFDKVRVLDHRAGVVGMTMQDNGELWLQVSTAHTGQCWWRVVEKGDLDGELCLPVGRKLLAVAGNLAWLEELDSDGLSGLGAYRVSR